MFLPAGLNPEYTKRNPTQTTNAKRQMARNAGRMFVVCRLLFVLCRTPFVSDSGFRATDFGFPGARRR